MSNKTSSLSCAHSTKNRPLAGLLGMFFCAGYLTAGIANAANPPTDNADEARWFQVELILFAHNNPQALDAEQWPEIIGIELPTENLQELHLPSVVEDLTADELADSLAADPLDLTANNAENAPAEMSTTDAEALPPTGPIAYQILDKSEWQLGKTAQRLRRSSRFEPLLHVAWRQPTVALAQARPILLFDGMDEALPPEEQLTARPTLTALHAPSDTREVSDTALPLDASEMPAEDLAPIYATEADTRIGPKNPRLIGTVKLSVARYLHLATNLIYRLPVTQQNAVPVPDFDLWYDRPYPTLYEPQGPAFQLEEWQAIRGFRMQESRRMRSKVLHYLDHPLFGMVVLITPVKLPKVDTPETAVKP